jgi:hypothetical protein
MKLYLRDWLDNFFETINGHDYFEINDKNPDLADQVLHDARTVFPKPEAIPADYKMTSVDLSSSLLLLGDISAGATPNFLGNGTAFIVPVSGLSLDYSPDYTDKIDIKMNLCNNKPVNAITPEGKPYVDPSPCYDKKEDPKTSKQKTALLRRQCWVYSTILPLLSNVTPPQDIDGASGKQHCDPKTGIYVAEIVPVTKKKIVTGGRM